MQERTRRISRAAALGRTIPGRASLQGFLLVALTIAVMAALMCLTQEAWARGRGEAGARAFSRAGLVAADPQGPGERGAVLRAQRQLRAERTLKAIEALKLRRLARELRLSADQQRIAREAYAKEAERKRELLRDRTRILKRMRQLMLTPEPAGMGKAESEMKNLVLEFKRLQREIARAEWETQDEILGHLPPRQSVRCILFNEGFDRALRVGLGAFCQRRLNLPVPPQPQPAAPQPPAPQPPEPPVDVPE